MLVATTGPSPIPVVEIGDVETAPPGPGRLTYGCGNAIEGVGNGGTPPLIEPVLEGISPCWW